MKVEPFEAFTLLAESHKFRYVRGLGRPGQRMTADPLKFGTGVRNCVWRFLYW